MVVAAAVVLAATSVLSAPAIAVARGVGGEHSGGHFGGHGIGAPHGFHGGPGHFHAVDPGHWRGGHWHHGFHGGRLGWWWVVGDGWYYYPSATYPYPQYWYYCPSAGAYYPYVAACPEGWTPVVPQ